MQLRLRDHTRYRQQASHDWDPPTMVLLTQNNPPHFWQPNETSSGARAHSNDLMVLSRTLLAFADKNISESPQ